MANSKVQAIPHTVDRDDDDDVFFPAAPMPLAVATYVTKVSQWCQQYRTTLILLGQSGKCIIQICDTFYLDADFFTRSSKTLHT